MTEITLVKRFCAVAVALGLIASVAQALDLRGGTIHGRDAPATIAMESFGTNVTKTTGDEISGKMIHDTVRFKQSTGFEQVFADHPDRTGSNPT